MMTMHKFKVGQIVVAEAKLFGAVPPGPYTVTRLLPPTGMSNQYRVKCNKTGHERVVREDDVSRTDH